MKLSKIFLLLVAAGIAVISSDAQERGRESNTRARGDDWRKAIEERMKQAREAREKASNAKRPSPSRGSSKSRTPQRSSGDDWRKAIEERMKQAREAREKAENNSRGRSNERSDRDDRGEDMRKAWEERMKQWQRERGNNDNRRGPQRGPQGQNWRGPRGR